MPLGHPCERGRRCSCHSAGPSKLPRKRKTRTMTTLVTAVAALACPVLAAPTPSTRLPFLYPTLEKRVTDAGQAPDEPSEGITHQHIQLADLIRAGLPYKYVYDPKASASQLEHIEANGAWVIDNSWALHGRRFGPLYATATAGITDDPLPTPTDSIPPASTPTLTTTSSPVPTVLAIQSSLPTGWDSSRYERSEMYAIPLVVSFALVIALMIGSLIGAMVIRRDRSRSRRRKKRIIEQDDDSARGKVVQSSLVSRVGRALRHRDTLEEEEQQQEEDQFRTDLEQRVKTWARRSAAWRAQARLGVRRRMGRGRKRELFSSYGVIVILPPNVVFTPIFFLIIGSQADGPAMDETIQEEPELEDEARNTRPSSPARSRAPTPIITIDPPNEPTPTSAAPNYSSPTVPTYSSPPPAAGPSTPSPLARLEAHPDATPSDEPAYDGPGSGQDLPPAYRGGGLSEVARGKRPAHLSSESIHHHEHHPQAREERREQPRVWTELEAYAFGQDGPEQTVTAHVATDDKHILERLHSMRGAPEHQHDEIPGESVVRAPMEQDVFEHSGGSFPSTDDDGSVPSDSGALPLPPSKTGAGPVARYGEADLCLPRYLDGGEGHGNENGNRNGDGEGMVPSAPEDMEVDMETGMGMVPSAPPCEEEIVLPSAPSALEDDNVPTNESAPPLDYLSPSAPLHDDMLHPDDLASSQTPHIRRVSSTSPLLSRDQ
ncbi:unnamed protein product [Rhizoctonia solani]|uniref:Transmembrane protein n=1 Tax=Rhizoctonia solani TaxID=456999 RepID=A0A8H2XP51_9AGAM|nr:unnamed protein product [Rhizoctonia solani]